MKQALSMGVYWGPRKETAQQAADRLLKFLGMIADCDEAFAGWRSLFGGSSADKSMRIDVRSRDHLVALVESGKQERLQDGFWVNLSNFREKDRTVVLDVHCGVDSTDFQSGRNEVTLGFPANLGGLNDAKTASRVLMAGAICWTPDWGVVGSSNNPIQLQQKPEADWMIYTPRKIEHVPLPSTVTHLETGGSLIVVQEKPIRENVRQDQGRVRRVLRALA